MVAHHIQLLMLNIYITSRYHFFCRDFATKISELIIKSRTAKNEAKRQLDEAKIRVEQLIEEASNS